LTLRVVPAMLYQTMDIVSLGELLMDMLPAETGRRLAQVSAFIPKPGGAVANAAVAAARLGAQVAFIGKVGQDDFGHALEDALEQNNVDTRGLRFDADARTTLAFIAQPDAHRNEYLFYRNPGADHRLTSDELDRALLQHTRILHVGTISTTDEPSRSATFEAIRIAHAHGALISFDVNVRPTMWKSAADTLEQLNALLPLADLVKVNETELELITDMSDPERGSAALIASGPRLAVITLGAQGSYYRTADRHGFVAPFQVEAIDSTGCGDAFSGALLVQLLRAGTDPFSGDIASILRYANAAGALTATRRGGIPALPTSAELDAFLASRR
jgi:fructokinase